MERWDGSAWSIQNAPTATGSELDGIACTSSASCIAAGHTDVGGAGYEYDTLAEGYSKG